MTDIKLISDLDEATGVAVGDLFIVVSSPSANAVTSKITANNLFGNIATPIVAKANVTVSNTAVFVANNIQINRKETPVSSAITVTKGRVFFDDNFIYIATANNTLKRAALSSF